MNELKDVMIAFTDPWSKRLKSWVELNFTIFPGGEYHVRVPVLENNCRCIKILFRSYQHPFLVGFVKDACARAYPQCEQFELIMPYLPYARQDRVCEAGDSFALKVFGDYINSLNFRKVTVLDPHSDVAVACLNNLHVIDRTSIIAKFEDFKRFFWEKRGVLISPDAGSHKKMHDLASYFGANFLRADKLRDTMTGKIKETVVYCDDLAGANCFIIDDIIDGGRTFIELAKVLKQKNANSVHLFATHGIFSQGLKVLHEHIDTIWTTDSCPNSCLNEFSIQSII